MEDKKLEILIVEDREDARGAAKQYFSSRDDVKVNFAADFEEAIQKLEGDKVYAGAILDINFPRAEGESEAMLGIELGKEVEKYRVPYVFLTASEHHQGFASNIFLDELCAEKQEGKLTGPKSQPRAYKESFEALLKKCPYENMLEIVEAKERAKKYGGK